MTSIINNFEITSGLTITDGNLQVKTNSTNTSLDVSGNITIGSDDTVEGNTKLILKNSKDSTIELYSDLNSVTKKNAIINKEGILQFTNNKTSGCLYEFELGKGNTSVGFIKKNNNNDLAGIVFGKKSSLNSNGVDQYENSHISYNTVNNSQSLNLTGEKLIFNTSTGNYDTLAQAMIIDISGRIGMGTSTSPTVSFEVGATDAIRIPSGTTLQRPLTDASGCIRYNTTTSSYEGFKDGSVWGTLGGVIDVDRDTYISAETTPGTDNDQLKFYTAGVERMIIDQSGNVDISGKVDISDNLTVGGIITGDLSGNATTVTNGVYTTGTQSIGGLKTFTSNTEIKNNINPGFTISNTATADAGYMYIQKNNNGNTYVLNQSNHDLILKTNNNSSQLVLKNNGNVGIGTNNPQRTLHLDGQLAIRNGTQEGLLFWNGINNTYIDINKITGTTGNATGTIRFHTSGNSYLNGGNVGIGTNNPGAKLEVFNGNINIKSGGPQVELISQDGKDGWTLNANVSDSYRSGRFRIISKDNNSYPSGAEKFTILRNGNVGIGTTSPGHTLEVKGELMVDGGWYRVSGNKGLYFSSYGGGWYMQDSTWIRNYNNKPVYLNVGSYNSVALEVQGRVLIGSGTPDFPLDVKSKSSGGYASYSYWNGGSTVPTDGAWIGQPNISIRAEYGVFCNELLFSSDERIKENIRDVSDNVALKKLRDISCCYYEYKDKLKKNKFTTIGFIAQQVREHMPMAVSIQKEIIPNEMRNIENPQWTTVTDASGNNTYKLTISDLEDASGNTSETTKYRFYVSNDPSGNDECEKEITSLENDPKSFIFEEQWQNVFLYGKEVNDFHTIDKQKLFALAFSATQEIDKIQQASEAKIAASETEINTLKNDNAVLLNKIATLESNFYNLQQQVQTLINNP